MVLVQYGYGMVRGAVRCGMVYGVARYVISYVGMVRWYGLVDILSGKVTLL